MNNSKLYDLLQNVSSKKTFLHFLSALEADKVDEDIKESKNPSNLFGPGWNGWENNTIAGFLNSMNAWTKIKISEEPSWKSFAEILYWGKHYE